MLRYIRSYYYICTYITPIGQTPTRPLIIFSKTLNKLQDSYVSSSLAAQSCGLGVGLPDVLTEARGSIQSYKPVTANLHEYFNNKPFTVQHYHNSPHSLRFTCGNFDVKLKYHDKTRAILCI